MKSPTYLLIVLLVISSVSAATVTLSPSQVYEATQQWIALDIDNYNSSSMVSSVGVETLQGVNDAKSYTGWTTTTTVTSASWDGGTLETNVKSAWFEFKTNVPQVNQNQNVTLDVDINGNVQTIILQVLDDTTGPEITNLTPTQYARANSTNNQIGATIIDPQTGIAAATYRWNDCNSGAYTNVALNPTLNQYQGTTSFSGTTEGSTACYILEATNNGGETTQINGTITFDGTAPNVQIQSPTDYVTAQTEFKFIASDNIAQNLDCTIKIGIQEIGKVTAQNNTQTSILLNVSSVAQGANTWSVTCLDGVGLSASSSTAIVVDTQVPELTLNVSNMIPRTQNVPITAIIADESGIASVTMAFDNVDLNVSNSGAEYTTTIMSNNLGKYNLSVVVTDNAGYKTTQIIQITVVPNHKLGIALTPSSTKPGQNVKIWGTLNADGATTNNSVEITFANQTLNILLLNNSYETTQNSPANGQYDIVAEYKENGVTYRTSATLTVTDNSISVSEPQRRFSDGTGFGSWRFTGGIKEKEELASEPIERDSSEQQEAKPQPKPTISEQAYKPLEAQTPRKALTPKATGVFDLGSTANWLAILLAAGLLIGLGIFGIKKGKKPKDEWEAYFKN